MKSFFLTIAIAILPFSVSAGESVDREVCSSLESCLAIVSVPSARYDTGISQRERAAAVKLQGFGRPAVKPLLQLLQSTDESVRNRAGYTLSGIKELLPEDLRIMQNAFLLGNGWVARAIGHVGTPEAFRLLVEDLRQNPETYTQTTGALADGGVKAIPFLLQAINCENKCPSKAFSGAIAFVFDQMEEDAESAAEPLVTLALDDFKPIELRLAALESLGAIGPYAKAHRVALRKLVSNPNRQLAESASNTLTAIGDLPDVPSMIAKLTKTEGYALYFLLRDISTLGGEGGALGPTIESILRDPNKPARAAAAETLGWIGYWQSIPSLMAAAQSQDWELAYQAAWSLGRLRATEARKNLLQLNAGHWSYPVRMAAAQALKMLDEPPPNFNAVKARKVIHNLNNLEQLISEAPTCEGEVDWHGEHLKLENNRVWPLSLASQALPKFIPADEGFVFPMDNGWLVGVAHGEFCGSLAGNVLKCGLHYFNSAGKHFQIAQGNVQGIYRTSNGLVFTQGVDHLGYGPGYVNRIVLTKPDVWGIQVLARLQAAPHKVAVARDGTLIVQTQGSVVAVTEGGKLEAVTCLDGYKTK